MEPDRHPVSQTQESKIDPRLQEAATSSQPFSSAAPVEGTVSDYLKLPPPLPPHPVQHQHQHLPYGAPAPAPSPAPPPPPPWTQDGFNPYYPQVYSPFHDARGAPLQHPMQAPLPDIADTKRPRACEACRSLKVKCEVDADGGQCKRCAKAGRACMITGPSRKRQKKTDSKVAELERKIDALEQNLKSTKEGNVNSDDDGIYEEVDNTQRDTIMGGTTFQQTPRPSNASGSGKKRTFSDFQQGDYPRSYPPSFPTEVAQRPPPKAPFMAPEAQMGPIPTPRMASTAELPEAGRRSFGDADVVSRGILQMATADALFVHYTQNMAPHMPIVVFSQDTTSEAVRKSTPVLFLAILSVTSGQKLPGLQDALKKEIMHTLVDRVINGVSKSLEILQAIQVITVWYLPEPGKDSEYFQLVHMAAGMAIDLGINKKPKAKRNHFSVLQQDSSLIDTESIECRRAWLGSYLLYSRYVRVTITPFMDPLLAR